MVWGDVVNSETRVVMNLLSLANIRYELQQVATPDVDYGSGIAASASPEKEDYLEIPLDQLQRLKKRVSGRSIYIGDR